jgi:hypothetical protein
MKKEVINNKTNNKKSFKEQKYSNMPYMPRNYDKKRITMVKHKKFEDLEIYKRTQMGLQKDKYDFTGHQLGDSLSELDWTHFATIRPTYKLNEGRAEKIAGKLMSNYEVRKIFYSVERDMHDNWYHMHLMLDAINVTKKNLAEYIGWNDTKVIGYLEKIDNKKAVAAYCAKRVGKTALCWNLHM